MWSSPPALWPLSAMVTIAMQPTARAAASPSRERRPKSRVVVTAATIVPTAIA